MHTRILFLILFVFLSGCNASPTKVQQDPSLNMSNASKLVVYRPSSDVLGIAIELRVFINDQFAGTLNSSGSSVERLAPSGTTTIEVKPYFLGIQDGKVASIKMTTEIGNTIYLRLNRDPGIPIVIGNAAYSIDASSGLQPVSENNWKERK